MSEIKFIHNEQGKIDLLDTNTGLSDAFAIGALIHTRKITQTQGSVSFEYPTDSDGLKRVISCTGLLIDFLNSSVSMLGVLLANVDRREVESELAHLGWLIVGLSDLAMTAKLERDEMRDALEASKAKETA